MVGCIAGGTSGIGAEVARRLLERGDDVIVVGRSQEHADEFRSQLDESIGERADIQVGDLRQPEVAFAVAKRIEERGGGLDLLVNAAGSISAGGIEVETAEVWSRVLSTNLDAAFNLVKASLSMLAEDGGGAIINVSSVCSLRPCSSLSYSVSKAGVDMFTRCLARELAPKGIRVNAVNPGVIRTNLQKSAGLFSRDDDYEDWVASMADSHPLGRIGEPKDVADAILFLADEREAAWVTGAILSVDGGRAVA